MYGFIIRYSCLEVIREMIEKEEKEILAMTDLVSGSLRDDPFIVLSLWNSLLFRACIFPDDQWDRFLPFPKHVLQGPAK